MRNTTRLYQLLMLYDVTFSKDEQLTLILVHKKTGKNYRFEDKTHAPALNKAHSFMQREVRKEDMRKWIKKLFKI